MSRALSLQSLFARPLGCPALEELCSAKDWEQGDSIKKVLEAKDGEGRGSVAGKGDEERLSMHRQHLPSHSDQNGPTSVACQ